MKNIYIIGGTMGVGKTTICQKLKLKLANSVFLDGDWCWDMTTRLGPIPLLLIVAIVYLKNLFLLGTVLKERLTPRLRVLFAA